MKMIIASIDVTLIDKARIKEVKRRNGQVAKFVDLVLIETPDGEYGDFIIKQGVTKEEREARKEMPILGNGKYVGGKSGTREKAQEKPPEDDGSEVPF